MALEDLTPSNRFELALSGDMTAEEASNRIEQILAGVDIEPADRLEYFLKLRVSEGGGGGGSAVEHGTFTPTERTQEHVFPAPERRHFLLFIEHGFSFSTGTAFVVEYLLEDGVTETAIGSNNTGTAFQLLQSNQATLTRVEDGYRYRSVGTEETARMLQAGFTYGWFAWD